tara:strand:+ start:3248 stop:3682 length:435 start_codon:yes stop_codon:yes gene_type:complete
MLEICINMRYFLILFFVSNALCQSDFLKPSDFNDNPPKFPTVNLPLFSSQDEVEDISLTDEINLIKGYRVQIVISQNEQELQDIKIEIEKSINEQIYIIFELPNYKLRVGNFVNRKEAESFQKKIVRLGYRTAWVVPTMIEKDD